MTPDWLPLAIALVLGAYLGSFANVVLYRIPRGESVVWPPSRCPACGRRIRWHDNIPIVSYFVLRGRCRVCGWLIPVRHLLVEIAGALIGSAVAATVIR